MIYCGPADEISNHFSALGYTVPQAVNVADYVMDILAGFIKKDDAEEPEDTKQIVGYLCDWWEKNKYPPLLEKFEDIPDMEREPAEPMSIKQTVVLSTVVFVVVALRHFRTFQRTVNSFRFTCFLLFGMGVIVSLLFGELDLSSGNPISQVSAMQLTFGLLCLTFGLKLFRNDALVRRREEEAGLWLGPYVAGKLCGCIIEVTVYPLVFLFGYYPFVNSAAPFTETWAVLLLLQLACIGLAHFVTVIVPGKNSNLVANGALVILWSFGGLEPTLETIKERMGGFGLFMNHLSPFKWSFERQMISELSEYSDLYSPVVDGMLDKLDYDLGNKRKDTGALIAYYVLANFLTYFWMLWARDYFGSWRYICDNSKLFYDRARKLLRAH